MEGKQRYIASRADEGFALVVVRRDVGGDWYASSDSDESDQESGLTADAAIRAWQAEYQPDGWHDLDELLARPTLADVDRARAEEREGCALVADRYPDDAEVTSGEEFDRGIMHASDAIWQLIRARGAK